MQHRDLLYLGRMLDSARMVRDYIRGLDQDAFQNDSARMDAVAYR